MRRRRRNRSCDFRPECCRDESGKMPHIRGRNDQTHPVQCCSLPRQDHVAVERGVRGGRAASLAGRGPDFRRATHRRGRDGQVFHLRDKGIEPRNACGATGSDELASDFVVRGLRNYHRCAGTCRIPKPLPACTAMFDPRGFVVRPRGPLSSSMVRLTSFRP